MANSKLQVAEGLTMTGLVAATGHKRQLLSRWLHKPGFPSFKSNGKVRFILADVERWIKENIKPRKGSASTPAPTTLIPGDDPFLAVLRNPKSTPVQQADAAMRIFARRLGEQSVDGMFTSTAASDLTKALQELRNAEKAYFDLGVQQREFIPSDEVRAMMAWCAAQMIRVMKILETSIATEFSVWLADQKVSGMNHEERTRMIQQFVSKQCGDLRTIEADQIEKMIDKGVVDDDNAIPTTPSA